MCMYYLGSATDKNSSLTEYITRDSDNIIRQPLNLRPCDAFNVDKLLWQYRGRCGRLRQYLRQYQLFPT